MLFNSYHFLIFFPIVVLLYFVLPAKIRWIWLLFTSYYFYGCWNVKHVFLLIYATVVSWLGALLIDKQKNIKIKKLILILSVIACLSTLIVFKYANWIIGLIGLDNLPILIPMGISFYTFQAVSYLIDIYRERTVVQVNLFRYALYVSFFPQLVAGPIERTDKLMPQIQREHNFDCESFKKGYLVMLYGFFLKLVISDRAKIYVDRIYGDVSSYSGGYLLLATVIFAIQIYCDFYGYSLIAKGSAKILGFDLMDNFDKPYLACSVKEFWRKWHISLSTWFRDYVYIPLGGSKKGKNRKKLNTMIVFMLSGLWHGADFSFIIWGGLHGAYIVIEEITGNIRKKTPKFFQIAITFFMVDIAWVFFRADSWKKGCYVVSKILDIRTFKDIFNISVSSDKILLAFSILLLLVIEMLNNKNKKKLILIRKEPFLFIEQVIILLTILVFGVYGSSVGGEFIYFQF